MLGLAASFVIASSSTSHSQGAPSVPNVANAAVNRAWARIEPSIVIVQQNGAPRRPVALLAVLASGAIPAELVTTKHLGVQNKSGSVITFSEIQFESAPSSVGGAPVFTYDGRLVGVLEATLAAKPADFAPKALA